MFGVYGLLLKKCRVLNKVDRFLFLAPEKLLGFQNHLELFRSLSFSKFPFAAFAFILCALCVKKSIRWIDIKPLFELP